jgi:hypothetical protein
MTSDAIKESVLVDYLDIQTVDDILDDYLVCTDEESTKLSKEYILDSLWAFDSKFLLSHTNYTGNNFERICKSLTNMCGELCEDANDIITLLLNDNLDKFVDDAISVDGRGHFLSFYDGNEVSHDYCGITYYIYRLN